MKATEANLLGFMHKALQFVIPIYQRTYSWNEKQCAQLWDDIVRTGRDDSVAIHFLGSIVYVAEGVSQVTNQSPLLVIDGQQRLATISLLIEALARAIGAAEPADGFSAIKLRQYYLTNPLENGDRFYKLLLSQTDAGSLKSIISNTEQPREASLRVKENFEYFCACIERMKDELAVVCRGLAKLAIVDIVLTRGQDNPQLIFESMNSTGKELGQADLIRNYILMDLEHKLQTKLYENCWRPMEQDFGQEAYGMKFDGFMRHYLTVKTGEIPRESDVYEAFKEYSRRPAVCAAGIEVLVGDIRAFAGYYCALALCREREKDLAEAFHDLRELKYEVAYPFLLDLYDAYTHDRLSKADLAEAVRLTEAYIFRRAVCAIPANSMNKTFATFARSLDWNRCLESIKARYLLLPSYRRFPSDAEFQQALKSRDLYSFRNRGYFLRRFENAGRKERVPVDEYTIEHIMPQNPDLSSDWQKALGSDWKEVQKRWLHTLGNLTLTGYNSELGDLPFKQKRDKKGGFADSPLKLNDGLGQLDCWNESKIVERAEQLAGLALGIWKSPQLEEERLSVYRPVKELRTGKYGLEDHQYLLVPEIRRLFDAFRNEVLGFDPCVTEEFMKQYVAYKAETNFVDVVPQAKRLRLSINMPFPEIFDPKGLCKDISLIGRWGNGDVEIGLTSLDDLPYIIGLVRQSFEHQIGDSP